MAKFELKELQKVHADLTTALGTTTITTITTTTGTLLLIQLLILILLLLLGSRHAPDPEEDNLLRKPYRVKRI